MTTGREKEFSRSGGLFALWAGVLVGPAVWLVQFQTNYTLVSLTCNHGGKWALHAVSVVALLLTAGAGVLAWGNWRDVGGGTRSKEWGVVPRSRFMSALGLLVSGMFFLVILAQWVASWVFGPCQW